jgi:hypothetical protein
MAPRLNLAIRSRGSTSERQRLGGPAAIFPHTRQQQGTFNSMVMLLHKELLHTG